MTHERMRAHYQTLLAPIYRWMLGDFSLAVGRSRAELASFDIGGAPAGARALDLGAGLGLQTIPLVELGYAVTAVDSSEALLGELTAACPAAQAIVGDMLDDRFFSPDTYDVIVCMGDTLTHLSSHEEVDALLAKSVAALRHGGTLAITFRDYVSTVRESTDANILVRSDEHRIHTCCLRHGREHVRVTDLVHERGERGWTLRASAYDKLRLAHEWVAERLRDHGASARGWSEAGRVCVVAHRADGDA